MHHHHNGHDHAFNTAISPELMAIQGAQDRISFTGVTFRTFPLKASINRLQTFCDNYVNFIDDQEDSTGHFFKAAAPYVTLAMINYGRMATESENLGWIAQHEVLFSVPVEWYRINDKGQLIFQDWAYICPFIYVDNDQSLGVGREVYGWTKVRAWLQPVTTSWTTDPRRPRRLLSLATELFPRLYRGDAQEGRTLIEIVQDAPPSLFRSPFSVDDPYNPWWSASRNLRRSASAMYHAFQFMSGLPIFGYDPSRSLDTAGRMSRRLLANMRAFMPFLMSRPDTLEAARRRGRMNPASPVMNNLTLKQFRDAQEPDLACYQALVNSRIAVENFQDGGLLGGPNLMMGDLTGGYRVHLHEYAEQPVVDTLGLEVSDVRHDEHGTSVAVLDPVMPTWMACDLRYDMGTTLAWRTRDSRWNRQPGSRPEPRPDQTRNRYNTTRGAAIQESIGPFHYPDTTLRVFPLMAERATLQAFCDAYINNLDIRAQSEMPRSASMSADTGAPLPARLSKNIGGNRFEPFGDYVYLVITSYGEQIGKMYTEQNNLGQTVRREVAFWVPVKWYSRDDESSEEVMRVAFLTPYVFCDSMRHALSELEVNGRPAQHSRIDSHDDSWLRESGPAADKKTLARLRTLLMPALNVGQPAEVRTLVEVTEGDVAGYNEDIPWAAIKANWKPELEADYQCKVKQKRKLEGQRNGGGDWQAMKDLFTRVAGEDTPINFINLKQYRATSEINKHCYQSLVRIRRRIKTLWDLREMPARMHVAIHDYATLPIVRQLGIKVKTVDSRDQAVVPQIEPIRPFFIRASIEEETGMNLYTRVLGQPWQRTTPEIDAPPEEVQRLLRSVDEPKAVLESVLWDSFAGHDKSNPYRNWQSVLQRRGLTKEEARDFVNRDQDCIEFFMRPDNFGQVPVNQQVFSANIRREEPTDEPREPE